MSGGSRPAVSVVVPVYNEADNIALLARDLSWAVATLSAEIIVVDDGSTDGSEAKINQYPVLKCVRIPRSGKSAALRKGIEAARGPVVITIDGDLQEDPAAMRRMVELVGEGWDLVIGRRRRRRDPLFRKRLPSLLYRWLILLLFFRYYPDPNCGFRAGPTKAFLSIPWFEGSHRLLPLLIEARGGRVTYCDVSHRCRLAGNSKFMSVRRLPRALIDLLKLRFGAYD